MEKHLHLSSAVLLAIFFVLSTKDVQSQVENHPENKYLIVLDAQQYYTHGKLAGSSAQKAIEALNSVISKKDADQVIYVNRDHKLLNLTYIPPFFCTSLDSAAMQMDENLKKRNENVFTREKPNAFSSNELLDFLKKNHVKEIIMIGFLAEDYFCSSVFQGKELGFKISVVPEAIIAKSQKGKDEALKELKENGVAVIGF